MYHVRMRTTVTPDPALAEQIRTIAAQSGRSMNAVANELLSRALQGEAPTPRAPFRVRARAMGLRPGVDPERITKSVQEMEDADVVRQQSSGSDVA